MTLMPTPMPTEAELVARAEAMIPWLREKADAVEKARMVPRDTIQAFHDAGFFRILQPRRWGGYQMSPNVLNKVLMELARGCPSSAWNVMVLGVHPFELGLLDPRCGDELWGQDDTRLVSSSYAPFGTVTAVEGGYVLKGEWLTSSGCDHAAGGAFLGGRVKENGEMVFRSFWVQAEDFEIVDDWHVVGLAGTGSKKLVVREAFVPSYRCHVIAAYGEQTHGQVENLYKMPFFYVFYAAVSSVIVGMARGMADLYIEHMVPRQNLNQAVGAAVNDPFIKARLGEAHAKILGAARRIVDSGLAAKGYRYVNIDDGWALRRRQPDGHMVPRPDRFPSSVEGSTFRPLTDKLHALGLKAGIYSDLGRNTCAQAYSGTDVDLPKGTVLEREIGLYGHIDQDIELFFADWGFDFIKVDGCGLRAYGPDSPKVRSGQFRALKPVLDLESVSRSDIPAVQAEFDQINAALKRNNPDGDFLLWCHGATFDAPILGEVYRRAGIPCPWTEQFWRVQCTRTLFNLVGVNPKSYAVPPPHVALNDAIGQTRAANAALAILARAHSAGVAA